MTLLPVAPPVVGLDPSLTAFGVATARELRTLKTPTTDSLRGRHARLTGITATVGLLVAEAAAPCAAALVMIEAPSLGQQRQAGAADRVGLFWLLVDELLGAGHLVVEIAPASRGKYATGKGNAGKTTVASAAAHRYGIDGGFADDNQADAFVLRAMGLDWLGTPLATVPKTHRAALDVVDWPTPEQLTAAATVPGPFAGSDDVAVRSTFGIRPHRPLTVAEDEQRRRVMAALPPATPLGQLAIDATA